MLEWVIGSTGMGCPSYFEGLTMDLYPVSFSKRENADHWLFVQPPRGTCASLEVSAGPPFS